jgi:uncharacterized protein YcbK (DUF882 family)
MDRDKIAPLTPELEANLDKLLKALNKLRATYGKPMYVSSGYRPAQINENVKGAAKKSNHMLCLACDFADKDGELDKWCLANLDKLEEYGLYLEDPAFTPNWCHLQVVPPKSGKRVFKP